MARLRVASPEDGQPEGGFADTARAALEQALSEGAIVMAIIYETPSTLGLLSVPRAEAVTRGLVEMAHREIQPEIVVAE